jgi:hypothetical protein
MRGRVLRAGKREGKSEVDGGGPKRSYTYRAKVKEDEIDRLILRDI